MDILQAVVAAVAGLTSVIGFVLSDLLRRRGRVGRAETAAERIDRLTKGLREAAAFADEIQREIAARQELARKLKSEVEQYEQIRALNQQEVEAVAVALRAELSKESSRSFRRDLLLNGSFFLAGAGLSLFLSLIFR